MHSHLNVKMLQEVCGPEVMSRLTISRW